MSGRSRVVCRQENAGGSMGRKIAIVGAGAVGGYAGAHRAQAGEGVTFIDPWPEHVEHMRKHGLLVTHAMDLAEVCRLVGYSDSAKVTDNLWGERWSKLVANVMGNGLSACTGLPGAEILQSEPLRRFSARLGSEAIRVGQAQGYQLEEILHLPPDTIARAGEGDEAAMRACDEQRVKDGKRTPRSSAPRW